MATSLTAHQTSILRRLGDGPGLPADGPHVGHARDHSISVERRPQGTSMAFATPCTCERPGAPLCGRDRSHWWIAYAKYSAVDGTAHGGRRIDAAVLGDGARPPADAPALAAERPGR